MFPHGVVTECYSEGKFCLNWRGRNHILDERVFANLDEY